MARPSPRLIRRAALGVAVGALLAGMVAAQPAAPTAPVAELDGATGDGALQLEADLALLAWLSSWDGQDGEATRNGLAQSTSQSAALVE